MERVLSLDIMRHKHVKSSCEIFSELLWGRMNGCGTCTLYARSHCRPPLMDVIGFLGSADTRASPGTGARVNCAGVAASRQEDGGV